MIAIIAAYARGRVIGREGKIPWDIPGEQSRFRELTTGKIVVMGRRTYEEIGRPLPNRFTILVSRTLSVENESCTTVPTLADALKRAQGRDIFISGGEQLYREALPLADVLYLTEIQADIEGDRYFPEFDRSSYELTYEKQVDGELPYRYITYVRRPMGYSQARRYVADIQKNSGIVLGLQPVRDILSRLGDPQDRVRYIHIAGTNGKGSVGAMLSSILTRAGYRTGHFSSPAVFDPMEPWRINGFPIPKEKYSELMTKITAQREAMERDGTDLPTAFELEAVLAFLYFAEESCDIAVLECGMGGAEDATNVISTTAVSVITAIGLDHTRFLGDTLTEIAAAKGGIIRPKAPVIMQKQSAEVENVIRGICGSKGSELYLSSPDELADISAGLDKTEFSYKGMRYVMPLAGSYQLDNAAQVLKTAEVLRNIGYIIPDRAIKEGLQSVIWHGRMETVCRSPRVIIDGAHNPNAAKRLRETIESWKSSGWNGRLYIIMGVLADKDFTEVAALVTPFAEKVFAVTPDNPRALSAERLSECVSQFCSDVQAVTVEDAVKMALSLAGRDDIILAFGSLSYLKELRTALQNILGETE